MKKRFFYTNCFLHEKVAFYIQIFVLREKIYIFLYEKIYIFYTAFCLHEKCVEKVWPTFLN